MVVLGIAPHTYEMGTTSSSLRPTLKRPSTQITREALLAAFKSARGVYGPAARMR